jgi:hypothetical protein
MQVFIDGTGIAFVDGGGGSDTITDTGSGFVTAGFAATDKIRVIGSASNDGDYHVTIYQIPKAVTTSSADESSHINLNRMLSLACLDYLKAMLADREGDIERKEYYMKEFWGKVGDNESNKRKISMSFPSSPYALK